MIYNGMENNLKDHNIENVQIENDPIYNKYKCYLDLEHCGF